MPSRRELNDIRALAEATALARTAADGEALALLNRQREALLQVTEANRVAGLAAEARAFGRSLRELNELRLAAEVGNTLRRAALTHTSGVAVDGLLADYLVNLWHGQQHILELKSWLPTEDNFRRAEALAKQLSQLRGVSGATVVLPNVPADRVTSSLASPDTILSVLTAAPERRSRRKSAAKVAIPKRPRRKVFALMPFAGEYDDVFMVAIRGAARAISGAAVRVDKDDYVGDVVTRVRQLICDASALVADLSESRPNVFFEFGLAEGLGKKVVLICSSPLSELPFDVRNMNVVSYEKGRTVELRRRLVRRLKAVFGE